MTFARMMLRLLTVATLAERSAVPERQLLRWRLEQLVDDSADVAGTSGNLGAAGRTRHHDTGRRRVGPRREPHEERGRRLDFVRLCAPSAPNPGQEERDRGESFLAEKLILPSSSMQLTFETCFSNAGRRVSLWRHGCSGGPTRLWLPPTLIGATRGNGQQLWSRAWGMGF